MMLSMRTRRKAVVVDFDLTLIKVNSFELFYKELAIYVLRTYQLNTLTFLIWQIILRKIRFISHAELKKRLLEFLERHSMEDFILEFVRKLSTLVNHEVVDFYEKYRLEGYSICLCTAAPALYIEPFLAITGLRFDAAIYSPKPLLNQKWEENLSEKKKENTLSLMKERGEILAVLLTDHYDDLPLLLVKKEKNILVNPTMYSLETINAAGVKYDLL